MYTCPFCMEFHDYKITVCPKKNNEVPPSYITDVRRRVPVVFLYTIGYSGHGKTCYLSSLFWTLRHGAINKKWPGFSIIGLNQNTLNDFNDKYVKPLVQSKVPPKTAVAFPTPLILKFQQIPMTGFWGRPRSGEMIFVFYDIGGETFQVDKIIKENLPILKRTKTLVFLVNLPKLVENDESITDTLQDLTNTIYLSVEGQTKQKNTLICFTRADCMWGKEDIYGPLSEKLNHSIPSIEEIPEHFDRMRKFSNSICRHVADNYGNFYNMLNNNFNLIRMTSLSSLGCEPKNGEIPKLAPSHIFDPILWTLRLEEHL